MLTTKVVRPGQAKHYYTKENYYTKEEANKHSLWSGRGAKVLGLNKGVDPEDFQKLVEGYLPNGEEFRAKRINRPGCKERSGLDCTFSAPKSVSIMALMKRDRRLEEAHRIAVKAALKVIEDRYTTTRVRQGSEQQVVWTNNLVIAQFDHDTNRELNPHLHTHCVLLNMTQLENGKWYALSNEKIHDNKKLLGQIYQNELAKQVQKLGYEIEQKGHGQFEIKGFTQEQIDYFSERRQQIKEQLGQKTSWAEREQIWDNTRKPKGQPIPRAELQQNWQREAEAVGIIYPKPVSKQSKTVSKPEKSLQEALADAIEHCSEREVAFKAEKLEGFILNEVGYFSHKEIEEAIANSNELIHLNDSRVTTEMALQRELATIRLMEQGRGQVEPIASDELVNRALEEKTLTVGQQEAVHLAVTTQDRFVGWQGKAGVGKTYALNELKMIAESQGYELKGFAVTTEAAEEMSNKGGIESTTIARLLCTEQTEAASNQLWIVDEAGLLSAQNGFALMEKAEAAGARVVLVGDIKQLSGVEAGSPFKSLQQAGMKTVHLEQSLRQQTPELQKAVELVSQYQVEAGIERLDEAGKISVIADGQERLSQIAQDYLSLSDGEREQTLVLTGTNRERLELTQQIREGLKREGKLGVGTTVKQLKNKDLSEVQKRYVHNYEVGDVLIPVNDYKRQGLERGRVYSVEAVREDSLKLRDEAGGMLTVDPSKFKHKTVAQTQDIEISVGDRLRWRRNVPRLGRKNGQEFNVLKLEDKIATIGYDSGKIEQVNLNQPQYLDYATVSTIHSSQGKTAHRTLLATDYSFDRENFYVGVSRSKYDLKIYTEDKALLIERAQRSRAKENPVELLRGKVRELIKQETVVGESIIPQQKVQESQQATRTKLPPPIKRQPPEAFWIPQASSSSPANLDAKHWNELVNDSVIHPEIAARNFRSLREDSVEQEHEAWGHLFYSDNISRSNTGRLSSGTLRRYQHIEAGGWWGSSGVDPRSFKDLDPGQKPPEKEWGCFKPNNPREKVDKPGKFIKYEHPPKTDLSIFLLDVPDTIAHRVYKRAGVNPSAADQQSGFWYCAWKYNLPITITEGAKKAASLLSQGKAAIGLPGIFAGYRTPKNQWGEKIGEPALIPELAVFATPERKVNICFDYETRAEPKRNLNAAISRTGGLFAKEGAQVKVVDLPGPEKGVDDYIVSKGPLAYEQQEQKALWLSSWRRKEWRKCGENYEHPNRRDYRPPAGADRESVRKPGEPNKEFEQQFDSLTPDLKERLRAFARTARGFTERRTLFRNSRGFERAVNSVTRSVGLFEQSIRDSQQFTAGFEHLSDRLTEKAQRRRDGQQPTRAERFDEHSTEETRREQQRQVYRVKYQQLQKSISNIPSTAALESSEKDVCIALMAYEHNASPKEVASILAQSDHVQDWKQKLPDTEFRSQAKKYILTIAREAEQLRERERQQTRQQGHER